MYFKYKCMEVIDQVITWIDGSVLFWVGISYNGSPDHLLSWACKANSEMAFNIYNSSSVLNKDFLYIILPAIFKTDKEL